MVDSKINHHHHHHVPGLVQTSAIMAFQPTLSSVLLMSSLLGDSFFFVKILFRLSMYFVRCLPLLLVPQNFALNICFSSPSALESIYIPKKCSCHSLVVLSRDLLYPTISITCSFDFFSVHDFLIILLMYHISDASSLLCLFSMSIIHIL